MRSCYTAMAIAHMLGLDKAALAERSGMVDYIARCQVRIRPRVVSWTSAKPVAYARSFKTVALLQ